jgi:protein SCO1/2
MSRHGRLRSGLLALCLPAAFAPTAATADGAGMHHDDAMHGTRVSWVDYSIPKIELVRENGQTVSLAKELDDGRPVVLNFIYTTCETTCPLSSQTFSMFQRRLGRERDTVHLVSISIDPEQDTPARLRQYAKKFAAGPEWQHYTGTLQSSIAAQQAFGVYRGDKMSHTPVTLLRAAPGKAWKRIDGFVTPDELLHQYHALLAQR